MRFIGLGTARWWRSILWGFLLAVISAVVVGALAHLTGYGNGPGSAAFEKLPLWLGFYLWRRDLAANMIGHGLVDFVANVLPKLFS